MEIVVFPTQHQEDINDKLLPIKHQEEMDFSIIAMSNSFVPYRLVDTDSVLQTLYYRA